MSASQLTERTPTRALFAEGRPNSARRWAWLAAFAAPAAVALVWPRLNGGWTHTQFDSVLGGLLAVLLAACAYTDISSRKIPNWATYPALLWALVLNAAHDLDWTRWLAQPEQFGAVGFAQSLLGAGVCFTALLLIYSISGGGAGDVKLAAVIGAFLGPERGLFALGLTYLAAGLVTVGWTILRIGPVTLVKAFARRVGKIVVPLWVSDAPAEEQTLLASPVPLAGFFAVGTLTVLCEVRFWEALPW